MRKNARFNIRMKRISGDSLSDRVISKTPMLGDSKGLSPQKDKRTPILSPEDEAISKDIIIPGSKLKWRRKYCTNPPNVIPDKKIITVPLDMKTYFEENPMEPHPCFNINCDGRQIIRFKPCAVKNYSYLEETMFFECSECHQFSFKDGEDHDRSMFARQLEEELLKDAYNALIYDSTPHALKSILSSHGIKSSHRTTMFKKTHKIYKLQDAN